MGIRKRVNHDKLAPDQWELRKWAWKDYDPAFHHISTRAHQSAAESRPNPPPSAPYAPRPASAHMYFDRLRRDLTADSCILAIIYRVLHVHCHQADSISSKAMSELPGRVSCQTASEFFHFCRPRRRAVPDFPLFICFYNRKCMKMISEARLHWLVLFIY